MAAGIDMKTASKTRAQRRMEKRQAAMLVLLVIVVALISFALGVVVGRHSGDGSVVQSGGGPQRISVVGSVEPVALPKKTPSQTSTDKLSFYENLSKDEPVPMGSGINLPPAKAVKSVEKLLAAPPVKKTLGAMGKLTAVPSAEMQGSKDQTGNTTKVGSAVAPGVAVGDSLPKPEKSGNWVVQVFSSRSAADAGTLRDGLSVKGYPAFITEADLGSKGLWYRVYLGPYAEKDLAQQARQYAEKKNKLKGFVKRR